MRVYLMQVYNDIVWQHVNVPHLQASSGASMLIVTSAYVCVCIYVRTYITQ